jgi:hypothetical protein
LRPVQVLDLAGYLPCEVFSRLSRCVAPLAGSLPPHVSHRRERGSVHGFALSLAPQGVF